MIIMNTIQHIKKTLFLLSVIAGALCLLQGCNLDLDPMEYGKMPEDKLPQETALQLYQGLRTTAFNNLQYVYWHNDALGDCIEAGPTALVMGSSFFSSDQFLWTTTTGPQNSILSAAYYANLCNLGGLTVINSLNKPETINLYAEGNFLLAWGFYNLANNFGGVAVPELIPVGVDNPSRNTERENYNYAISKLEIAEVNATDFTSNRIFSKQAAQALLARLYLQVGRYDDAITKAQAVISSGKAPLFSGSDYRDIFIPENETKELIYGVRLQVSSIKQNYAPIGLYGSGSFTVTTNPGWQVMKANGSFATTYFDPTDKRNLFDLVDGNYYLQKFNNGFKVGGGEVLYPIVRTAEMYLVIAEATARKGTVDVSAYNTLRTNRGASTKNNSDFANPQAFLDEILKERKRELVGEAVVWMDMRRFGTCAAHIASYGQPAYKELYPIPATILTANPGFTNNSGY